jgi:CXXX repeat peptide maturase
MFQYLIILLDDTSVSYCHYEHAKTIQRLIKLDDLKAGILFAMKRNMMIEFVYPDYKLPHDYLDVIESIDSHKITPQTLCDENADIIVIETFDKINQEDILSYTEKTLVIHTVKSDFFTNSEKIISLLGKVKRLNVLLSDVDSFVKQDVLLYQKQLEQLKDSIKRFYQEKTGQGYFSEFNLLTDRIILDKMNNCNAGVENITLAPNGEFYICPAFYYANENDNVGNPVKGIDIKNKQLYELLYAPLCRKCDAYQCKRCVWLNHKTTGEVNIPSHEQCVIAHLERNVSRCLLHDLQEVEIFADKEINEIDYLDPFEIENNN